jgi:MerR family transcriptional regulator, heat shock protein HspR
VIPGAAAGVPPRSSWQERLDDPAEPLYTMGVVCELLGVEAQVVRRLDHPEVVGSARPSGNQRRFSRNDIAMLSYALTLAEEGIPLSGISRILVLERELSRAREREP